MIQVRQQAENFIPDHLALKMGIATAVVYSWESGTRQPDDQQLKVLAIILGFDPKDFVTHLGCLDARE